MPENQSNSRVVVSMKGNLQLEPMIQVKYGQLIQSLRKHLTLNGVFDTSLKGFSRFALALTTWHPEQRLWRERYLKHPKSFEMRSLRVSRWVRKQDADAITQLGVLFDSRFAQDILPNVIYTDYTSQLSAQHLDGTRSPYKGDLLNAWLSLEKQAYENAAHICVRSHKVCKSLIEDYGLSPEKISVIGGGANIGTLPDAVTRPIGGPPRLLFIGLDFYRKGGDLVLKAFAEVRKHVPQSRLTMITRLPKKHDLPLTNVDIISSEFNRELVCSQFPLADIFILPSRLETWGDVILEAMAYGLACIGVTGQPMEEIILHGKTGLLTDPENPHSLYQAMHKLLSDRTECRKMGIEGRRHLEKEFTWPIVARRLSKIVKEVAAT